MLLNLGHTFGHAYEAASGYALEHGPAVAAGLVAAAYFSAIMSTADSCMMAASGNFVGDFLARWSRGPKGMRAELRASMLATGVIGILAVLLAARFTRVLDLILHAYTFMVAGLLVPTIAALWTRKGGAEAAIPSMLVGGSTALTAIAEGTYGVCIDCEEPIPVERLEKLPSARRCRNCQERFEHADPRPSYRRL